jgi:hypothetical protein
MIGAVGLALVDGCSAGSSGTGGSAGSANTAGTAAGGAGGNCGFGCDTSGTGQTQQLVIAPASATLTVVNGQAMTQTFTVTLDGNDVTSQVAWSYERPDIGDVTTGSTFTPTGNAGGSGKLTASLAGKQAQAQVTVNIQKVVNTANLDPGTQATFDSPVGPDPAMNLVYPYDQTVFPLDVLSPDIQWNGGGGGDVYRLKITEKYYSYTEYFSDVAHHLIAESDWTGIETSGSGSQSDPVTVELARKSGANAYQAKSQTWHIALGRLKGSVYYWELPDACSSGNGNGRILRIKPSSTQVDTFFDPGGQCWGCHTVSRNGKQLAAEFFEGDGPLGTLDLSQTPVTYAGINPNSPNGNYIFSAFNDTGDKLLASANGPRQLDVISAANGSMLAQGVLGSSCGEPAWSPDGKKIAGVCNMDPFGWTFDSNNGDLFVADIDPTGTMITNSMAIVPKAGGAGRPAYPSFSPDSKYLAFGRPTYGSRSIDQGTLWLAGVDGSGAVELANAEKADGKSFNPVFAPLRAGGYYWIVFISRRDYGNQLVGQNRQQLWITAVDDPLTPGVDPSHPPFYVRGQESCAKSENAYYALDPCKDIGQDCTSGVDCCGGQCVKDPNTMKYVCGTPPSGMCSDNGNACKVKADCCDPAADCVDGFCTVPTPK